MNDWAHVATELIGRSELKRLSGRRDAPGLLQLGLHVALLVAAALWIAFLSALASKRWLWVLCLSLFPVPALFLILAVLTLVG